MKSAKRGKRTLKPEITNVSEHGFWLFHEGKEYFLDFAHFPWFRKAAIEQIADVLLQSASHLYWPQLDIDLSFDIIEHPDNYKLVSK